MRLAQLRKRDEILIISPLAKAGGVFGNKKPPCGQGDGVRLRHWRAGSDFLDRRRKVHEDHCSDIRMRRARFEHSRGVREGRSVLQRRSIQGNGS